MKTLTIGNELDPMVAYDAMDAILQTQISYPNMGVGESITAVKRNSRFLVTRNQDSWSAEGS